MRRINGKTRPMLIPRTALDAPIQETLIRARRQSRLPRYAPESATAIVAVLGIVGSLATLAIVGTIAISGEN